MILSNIFCLSQSKTHVLATSNDDNIYASISLELTYRARILINFTTSANKGSPVQSVGGAKSSGSQLCLASIGVHDWNIHLLENLLVLALDTKFVLTPTGYPASEMRV